MVPPIKQTGMKKTFNDYIKKGAFTALLLLVVAPVFAAPGVLTQKVNSLASMSKNELLLMAILGLLFVLAILLLVATGYILWLFQLIFVQKTAPVESSGQELSLWEKINRRFVSGNLVEVGKEDSIMLDHEYDGIVELDNSMPPWLKYVFYITIIFGVVYTLHYLVLGTGITQEEEYQAELLQASQEAESRKSLAAAGITEDNAIIVTDEAALSSAAVIYAANCAACHGKDGGGGIGPNLADEYWVYGGSVSDIFKSIKYGIPEKGMIPWEGKLSPEEIQNLTSYLISLEGTTPANPKGPQGEKFVR
jgi:cytochrome c oxidase cbb3-type subunit III